MTTTDTELKPCPLCDSPAELDRYSPFRHYRTGEPLDQVSVYCTSCSLNLSWYPGDLDLDRDQTAEFVVESWNARHRTLTPAQAAGPVLLEAAKLIVADCSYHLQKYRPAQLHELRAAITQAEGPQDA